MNSHRRPRLPSTEPQTPFQLAKARPRPTPLRAAARQPAGALTHSLLTSQLHLARGIADHRTQACNARPPQMGKAYNQDQRDRVKLLLEAGRDEDTIEKETGVSDRTIRRWKMELERTGRIGKPPESRTGRHRVLNAEVENVSFARGAYTGYGGL